MTRLCGCARVLALACLTLMTPLVLLAAAATPAAAHGRGSDATNYSSVITAAPELAGVSWRVHNGDEFLGVENLGEEELAVPGYEEGERYLRIGPEGVFVNRNSKAFYQNQDRLSLTRPPPGVGQGAPEWVKVSDEPRYAWHDHRIHWMSPTLPPQVTDRGELTRVMPWSVDFTYGGRPQQIAGTLDWVPGPSPFLWLLPALLVVGVPALVGLRSVREGGLWPGLVRPAAVVLAVVSALNLLHLVDDLVATPLPLTRTLLAAVQTVLFIAIGLFGAFRAWQAREGAFTALAVGAGAIFVGQGLLYFAVLSASQTASVFPGWLTRAVVAATVVQVLPLGFVAFWGNTRTLADAPTVECAPTT